MSKNYPSGTLPLHTDALGPPVIGDTVTMGGTVYTCKKGSTSTTASAWAAQGPGIPLKGDKGDKGSNGAGGDCRLTYVSATQIRLDRCNGNSLNGMPIPAAGLTLSNAGLAASTLYYVYALMVAGVMTLEPSTTGYAVDAASGVQTKTGDPTLLLVGMVRTDAGGKFVSHLVASFYNRRRVVKVHTEYTNLYPTAAASAPPLSLFVTPLGVISWPDEPPVLMLHGSYQAYAIMDGAGTMPRFIFFGTVDGVDNHAVMVNCSSMICVPIFAPAGYHEIGGKISYVSGSGWTYVNIPQIVVQLSI
jgi:hypothetical protein